MTNYNMKSKKQEAMEAMMAEETGDKLAIGVSFDDKTQIITNKGWHVCYIEHDPHLKIAEFIVRACNSHDDLLEALKLLVEWIEQHFPEYAYQGAAAKNIPSARAAIKKAQGE